MDSPTKLFVFRLRSLIWLFFIALTIISGRLFHLQIRLFDQLFQRGQRNFIRVEKIISPRGNILDCKGRPLATNKPLITLFWQGTGKKEWDVQQQALLTHLQALFGKDFKENKPLRDAERYYRKIVLVPDISFEHFSCLIEQYPGHPNLVFTTSFKRHYPYTTLACHIVGYLGSLTSQPTGQMGLEKIYEEELRGSPGEVRKKVNSRGQQLAEEEIQKTAKGEDLKTTIDLDLQQIAEEIFPTELAGVIVAMSPQTGALKVVVSRPVFNPNIFLEPLNHKKWDECQDQRKPFLNRAFSALYPPASLFKLVTITAALENNLIEQDTNWYCGGYSMFAGRPYYCHKQNGHGPLTTMQAVAQSCNIPFYEIAKKIKIDTLADYANRFGLGIRTNTVFPERAGLIPTAAWKRQYKGEPWWPGETLSAAIGQSFLLVTPVQMARMISAICEGYLIKPCILLREAEQQAQNEKAPLEISRQSREFLKQSMLKVAKGGTGQRLSTTGSKKKHIIIHAKTGTAQTSSLAKRDFGNQFKEHAWCVAHVQYENFEPLTLLVLLENAGSSRFATEIAKIFLSRYYHQLESETTQASLQNN